MPWITVGLGPSWPQTILATIDARLVLISLCLISSYFLFYIGVFMSDSGTPRALRMSGFTLTTGLTQLVGAVWGGLTGDWIVSLLPSLSWVAVFVIWPGLQYSCVWLGVKLKRLLGRG